MDQNNQSQSVAKIQPSRLPISQAIADEYELTPGNWRVLVEQIFPSAKTPESVFMALSYCKSRNLDIFKRPVHIVPVWSTEKRKLVETVWPGIAEVRTTAARTGEYAGADKPIIGDMKKEIFSGPVGNGTATQTVEYPTSAEMTVYRFVAGQRCPFTVEIWWKEAYASMGQSDVPNSMWSKRPIGQLVKCLEAAALRMAFPEELGGIYAAEEMAGQTVGDEPIEVISGQPMGANAKTPPTPPTPPKPPASEKIIDNDPTEKPKGKAKDTSQPMGGNDEKDDSPPTPPKALKQTQGTQADKTQSKSSTSSAKTTGASEPSPSTTPGSSQDEAPSDDGDMPLLTGDMLDGDGANTVREVDYHAVIEDFGNDMADLKTLEDLKEVREAYRDQIEAAPREFTEEADKVFRENAERVSNL